ncbi:MAG: fibronectin type III-like domain-contianing protein [Steroidobacteraceae bacterium]
MTSRNQTAKVALEAGRRYRIRIEYVSPPIAFHTMHLGIRLPPGTIAEAVEAARQSDAALVFVDSSQTSETEAVRFTLSPRDLSCYDVHRPGWISTPGTHRIYVGSSSRDIRERRAFELLPAAGPR